MEELQSTEILDREILEDARKKAHKILKAADDAIKTKSTEWDTKLEETLDELKKKYAQSEKHSKDEIMAVLPLDKRRAKAKKIEEMLNASVEAWYSGLNRKQVLGLIQNELTRRIKEISSAGTGNDSLFDNAEIHALIHKIDPAEADKILQAVLPGKDFGIEEILSTAVYPELVLETKALRVYASVGRAVEFILGEKRAELVEALLGKAALLENGSDGETPC